MMKINEFSFKNHANGWELEKTKFGDLTLLVGASGVGKTQILKSLQKLAAISNGEAFDGVEWDTTLTLDNGSKCRWTGRFVEPNKNLQNKLKPSLISESVFLDDDMIFERKSDDIRFDGKALPKISSHSSVLDILTEEGAIKPIKSAIDKITLFDYNNEKQILAQIPAESFLKHTKDLESIKTINSSEEMKKTNDNIMIMQLKEDNIPIFVKLLFVEKFFKKFFLEIVQDYQEVFPQVEQVRFELLKAENIYELQIKEKGTGWISLSEISSGMFKTLLHIAELKLMAKGSVILIDEFENSLGVNCIDSVANNLFTPGRHIQYIITSHHPYIINNIDMKYWKVVTRKGSTVSTLNVDQLKLGKSKHEAFKQLLNLEEFAEGIS